MTKSTKTKQPLTFPATRAKAPVTRKPLTLAKVQRGASIYDRYFSIEQQAQIGRLQVACDFEGATESEAIGKTIATLAAAALWVLGLDPLSRDSFERISDVVLGKAVDADYYNELNDKWEFAENWTKKQRAAELGEPQGAKADEATA